MNPDLAKELEVILKEEFHVEVSLEEASLIGGAWIKYFDVLLSLQQHQKKGQDGT